MFHRAKNLAFNSNCPQAEKTQGFASMLVLIAVLATINLISAEQRDVTRLDDATLRRQDSTVIDRQGGYSPFKRWEIDEETESDNSIISRPQRHQGEYKCGRAIAIGNKDPLFSKEQQVSRVKYRPLEIRMPRIIGGEETQPGEFPWTVSVKLNGQPICGGSLIEKSWILTAAHCVVGYNPKNLTVRLGAFRIKDMRETQTVDLSVSMFIVHKDYSIPRPFSNDIALLKMIEPVDFTDFIIPICLPNEDMARSPTDHSATASESTAFSKRPVVVVAADGDEEAGIVVSTKMSDNDIAKCFSRLEQNYLSSIGMGASTETATSSERPSPGLAVAQRSTTSTTSAPMPSYLFSHGSPSDAVFMTNDDRELASESVHQTFAHSSKPMGPYFGSESNSVDVYNPSNYVYQHAYHWNRKQSPVKIPDGGSSPRRNPIKLSRLPISKELLREIQSVGSGAMPTLSLGIQQGDFVAMASDLTQSSANKDRVSNFANRNQISGSPSMQLEDMDDPGKYSGLSGIVVGWGWVRELDGEDQVNNKGYPSVELQKVKLPILRNNVCEAWFQSQAKKITLLPSQFCAGFSSGGKDACRGDSGGPMVIEDNSDIGRYKLIGIVSAGIGCARPSLPGLYTRVASFIPWINAQMVRY